MLPRFQSEDSAVQLMQTAWSTQLNPIIANPITNPVIIKEIALVTGSTNTINHLLSRELQGWFVIRQRASSIIWDTQDVNPNPTLTLYLNCSANVTVDIAVF